MCTTISVRSKEGLVMGRSMEFGVNMDFESVFIPRNAVYTQDANGKDLKSTYALIGSTYFKVNAFNDGVNEKGLMGCVNYFPGYADYPEKVTGTKKISMAPEYLLTYLLTNCANVAEVREAVKEIELIDIPLEAFGKTMTLHYAIFDKAGNKIIIEPVNKTLEVYDNPVGVMTNSPDYNWHMTNLRNFLHLQPTNRNEGKFSDYTPVKFGEGSGQFGLPGDFTPTSRFVRAAYFVSAAPEKETAKKAVDTAFHILSQFDIPDGAIYNPDLDGYDVTQYTACVDSANLAYYVTTIEDAAVRTVSLNDLDLDSKEIVVYPMSKKQTYLPLV